MNTKERNAIAELAEGCRVLTVEVDRQANVIRALERRITTLEDSEEKGIVLA